MKIIKANIKDNKVFIGNDEVKNCIIFNSQKNSSGYVLANEEVFIFIDNELLKNIISPLIDIVKKGIQQIANSVVATQYINPSGNPAPVITNISVDIQPIIQEIEELKEKI